MVDTASCTYLPSTWRTRLLATACKDCTGLKTRLPLTLIGQSSVGKLINMTIFKIFSRTVSEFLQGSYILDPSSYVLRLRRPCFTVLSSVFSLWLSGSRGADKASVPVCRHDGAFSGLRHQTSERQLHVRHIIILTQTKETTFCRLAFCFQSLTLWFSRSWQGDSPSVQSWWRP